MMHTTIHLGNVTLLWCCGLVSHAPDGNILNFTPRKYPRSSPHSHEISRRTRSITQVERNVTLKGAFDQNTYSSSVFEQEKLSGDFVTPYSDVSLTYGVVVCFDFFNIFYATGFSCFFMSLAFPPGNARLNNIALRGTSDFCFALPTYLILTSMV